MSISISDNVRFQNVLYDLLCMTELHLSAPGIVYPWPWWGKPISESTSARIFKNLHALDRPKCCLQQLSLLNFFLLNTYPRHTRLFTYLGVPHTLMLCVQLFVWISKYMFFEIVPSDQEPCYDSVCILVNLLNECA